MKWFDVRYKIYRLFRRLHIIFLGLKLGCFIQDPNNTEIHNKVLISHGVQIYTKNHNIYDLSKMDKPKLVKIEKNCWLGANSIILLGVHLGEHTIVGAGAVVTKSFPNGFCVIAGNPAEKIKEIKI